MLDPSKIKINLIISRNLRQAIKLKSIATGYTMTKLITQCILNDDDIRANYISICERIEQLKKNATDIDDENYDNEEDRDKADLEDDSDLDMLEE
jgi:hypothetical protein